MKNVTKTYQLISKIADRVIGINPSYDKMTVFMDLGNFIEGGGELRLEEMLEASPADLMHDVAGINQHLNHLTRKLEGGFWPRFAN